MVLVFSLADLEKHMECSPSAEAALHPGDKPHWVTVSNFLIISRCILLGRILWRRCASAFIRDIGPGFSLLVGSWVLESR